MDEPLAEVFSGEESGGAQPTSSAQKRAPNILLLLPAYDGQYKVVRGFNANLQHNSSVWTPCSKEVQGLPLLAFDLIHDPRENANLAPNMPAGAQRVLEMVPSTGCA
jgi:hypothetical protein